MPTRKIEDPIKLWAKPILCNSPDHNIPNMQVFENGSYEHECSTCGRKQIFHVSNPTC